MPLDASGGTVRRRLAVDVDCIGSSAMRVHWDLCHGRHVLRGIVGTGDLRMLRAWQHDLLGLMHEVALLLWELWVM